MRLRREQLQKLRARQQSLLAVPSRRMQQQVRLGRLAEPGVVDGWGLYLPMLLGCPAFTTYPACAGAAARPAAAERRRRRGVRRYDSDESDSSDDQVREGAARG